MAVKRAVLDQVVLPEDLVIDPDQEEVERFGGVDDHQDEQERDTNQGVNYGDTNASSNSGHSREEPDTLLQFYKNWLFTASKSSKSTSVKVHQTLPSGSSILIGEIGSERGGEERVTQMRLDEEIPPSNAPSILRLRLVIFYSSTAFTLHSITLPTASSSPPTPFSSHIIYTSSPSSITFNAFSTFPAFSRPQAHDPVILAKWSGSLLVAMTSKFVMRFWRVVGLSVEGDERVELVESDLGMRSSERWEPVVLDLRRISSESSVPASERGFEEDFIPVVEQDGSGSEIYKVTLAYSTPIFPSDWSVGIQEFHITLPPLSPTSSTSSSLRGRIIITSRHAVAPSVRPPYFAPTTTRRGRDYREANQAEAGREGEAGERERRRLKAVVTGIEFSWPFIITSRSDNVIDLFLLSSPTPSATSTSTSTSRSTNPTLTPQPPARTNLPPLKLHHFKSLYGHTSSVESVAIKNGGLRCVSGGRDGRIRVWSLGLDELSDPRPCDSMMERADGRESVVDVFDHSSSNEALESKASNMNDGADCGSQQTSNWSNLLKEYNLSSPTGGEGGGRRIKKVWFDEEKILCLESGGGMGERGVEGDVKEAGVGERERIRVMRFD